MNVLIAEDDRVSRMTLSACLRGWGYEVISVDNGQEAFDLLAQPDGPRLALLDWEMPGLDGIEVCARVRAVSGLPFRYLIVLTGRDREEDIVAALDRGADDHITKPWKPGELRARLGVGQRMVQLQEQVEANNRTLSLAAQTDYLTGIWNRSAVTRARAVVGADVRRGPLQEHQRHPRSRGGRRGPDRSGAPPSRGLPGIRCRGPVRRGGIPFGGPPGALCGGREGCGTFPRRDRR